MFRQSDRSQPELRTMGISTLCIHHPQPTSTSSLSLCLSVLQSCLGSCFSSSFPSWNLFPDFSSLFRCISLSFPVLLQLCSLLFSYVSLSVSLPLLLRFNMSPGGRRKNSEGGCKNIYGFIYKGPRYCPALNPGEMIYFPSMCGTDPRGVTQQWTGFVLAIYGGWRGS